MAITIFSIPLISASLERVFLGAKHIIALERVRLGAKMLEMAESLKSWVCISKTIGRAPLSGVFINSRFIDKALKVLEGEGNSNKVIKVARLTGTVLHTGQV